MSEIRNFIGYGNNPPKFTWENNAKLAVQFVLNYEEGGENTVLNGDEHSEIFLSEIIGAKPIIGDRHMNMESIYEYGSRVGFWRIYNEFIKSQTNHPKINYSRFMIFLSYSKLISNKDLDLGPSLKVVELYNAAPQSYLDDEYMEQTDKIYKMARKFILKRAIYISKFYIEKGEFVSACSRIDNASTLIPDLVENSYEAQYLKVVCLAKDKNNNVAIEDLRSSYKSKFPNSPFLDDLDEI